MSVVEMETSVIVESEFAVLVSQLMVGMRSQEPRFTLCGVLSGGGGGRVGVGWMGGRRLLLRSQGACMGT